MSNPSRFPRLLVMLRLVLLGAGAWVVLVALFYGIVNWRGSREWRAERQRIEALGRHTDITALVPPAVPDGENFAMIPLFRPLFDYGRHQDALWSGIEWRDTNGNAVANDILAFGQPMKRRFNDPPERSWTRGERLDLKAWQTRLRDPKQQTAILANLAATGQDTNLTWLPEGTPASRELLHVLEHYAGSFDTLAKGARLRHSQFPVHYEEVYAALLPHLHLLKRFTTRFGVRATARLEEGQIAAAAEDVESCLRFADAIRTESFLISQIVRQANFDLALQPLWEGLTKHAWTDAELTTLQNQIASIDLMSGWRRSIEMERAVGIWSVQKMAASWQYRRMMFEMYESIGRQPGADLSAGFPLAYALLAPRGWFYGSLADASKTLETLENATPQTVSTLRANWHPLDSPLRVSRLLYYSLMANGLGKLPVTYINTVRCQIHLQLAATACALERHRLANGAYPDTLAALVPKYLPSVPVDPIDGQTVRYRRDAADRFALWSVGENGRDDGGTFPTGGESTAYEGDWVWRWPDLDSN